MRKFASTIIGLTAILLLLMHPVFAQEKIPYDSMNAMDLWLLKVAVDQKLCLGDIYELDDNIYLKILDFTEIEEDVYSVTLGIENKRDSMIKVSLDGLSFKNYGLGVKVSLDGLSFKNYGLGVTDSCVIKPHECGYINYRYKNVTDKHNMNILAHGATFYVYSTDNGQQQKMIVLGYSELLEGLSDTELRSIKSELRSRMDSSEYWDAILFGKSLLFPARALDMYVYFNDAYIYEKKIYVELLTKGSTSEELSLSILMDNFTLNGLPCSVNEKSVRANYNTIVTLSADLPSEFESIIECLEFDLVLQREKDAKNTRIEDITILFEGIESQNSRQKTRIYIGVEPDASEIGAEQLLKETASLTRIPNTQGEVSRNPLSKDDYIWYTYNREEKTAKVVYYEGETEYVIVPEWIGKYRITEIGPGAFSGRKVIRIPNSVKQIDINTFSDLEEVSLEVFPGGAAIEWAQTNDVNYDVACGEFEYEGNVWKTLKNVNTGDVEIVLSQINKEVVDLHVPAQIDGFQVTEILAEYPNSTFLNLTEVDIENGVERIGMNAFKNAHDLRKVRLPDSIEEIGDYAFYNLSNLEGIDFPDNLQKVGSYAFYGCNKVDSLKISENVNEIGTQAFAQMNILKNIEVSESNTRYAVIEDVLFDKKEKTLIIYPAGKENENYSIPQGVLAIGDGAFSGSQYLKSVYLPDSISLIGSDTFCDMDQLENISIPNTVNIIGAGAFSNNAQLKIVYIPGSVKEIGDRAFTYLNSLIVCVIQEGVQRIGEGVLSSNPNLGLVFLPDSITEIGENFISSFKDFDWEENDCRIVVKRGTYVDQWIRTNAALSNRWLIQNQMLQDGYVAYSDASGKKYLYKLDETSLTAYTIKEENTAALFRVFDLTDGTLKIPTSIEQYTIVEISDYAFRHAQNLAGVLLPENLKRIGEAAFSSTNVQSVEIPESVTELGSRVFEFSNIQKIVIPGTIETIPTEFASNAKNLSELIISEGVKEIGQNAFEWCIALENVTLPSSIIKISDGAFMHDVAMNIYPDTWVEKYCAAAGYTVNYLQAEVPTTTQLEIASSTESVQIMFPNQDVENEIRYLIQKWNEPIYPEDVKDIQILNFSYLYDVDFLKCFVGLRQLIIAECRAMDLSPLSSLYNLEELDLSYSDATDIKPLANLNNLKSLNLTGCDALDYSTLTSLTNLETLYLGRSKIKDLAPISQLMNLKYLDIKYTEIKSIRPLVNLQKLEYLDMAVCREVSDLSPLFELPNLKTIWLLNNAMGRDMQEQLGDCVHLTYAEGE